MKVRLLLGIIVLFAFFSCTSNNSKLKVAFLFPNFKSERYIKEKEYFKERIAQLGGEAEVVDANYDQEEQIKQAKKFLDDGVKVLVVGAVNANLSASIVRLAHSYGAIVIAYDRLIKNCGLDWYLSFNGQKVGELLAGYITQIIPQGNFIVIGGDKSDFNAIQINIGQMKVLKPMVESKKVSLLYNVFIEEWNTDNARVEVEYYLNLSNQIPDAVICSSDRMAMGVVSALEKNNLAGKVLLTGMDADKTALHNILSGKQTMSVYKPFKQLAYLAAETAMKAAKGEKIESGNKIWNGSIDVSSVLIEPKVVDKNNIRATVIADGLYTESEIYGK